MRGIRGFVMAGLALALVGCDSGGPEDRLPEELAGTWRAEASCAECSFVLTSVENPELSIDLLDPPTNVTAVLQLTRGGSATLDMMGSHVAGSARVDGNLLILTAIGSSDTIAYTVVGNTLTLDFRTALELVDFDGDLSADPAEARAVLRKQ